MGMTNLKLTKAEKKATNEACCVSSDGSDYPWGLALRLDDTVLEKLSITDLPDAEATCRIKAVAMVTSVESSASSGGGKHRNVSLQITDIDIVFDDNSNFDEGFKK